MELDRFWSGAVRLQHRVDWSVILASEGVTAIAEEPWQVLRRSGVDDALVEEWRRSELVRTSWRALTLLDPAYPEGLRASPWPPPVLFVEGPTSELQGVGVVGTRACTAYGRNVAHHLGAELASTGVTVVSGLARGIDAAAHRGAMGRGRTVAVLGHGLSHTAPQSHRRLRKELLERGGSLVSAFPDELSPRPHMFPIRNRWIVGLSSAVVVVEAGLRSGAGITARLALEADRAVFAVPGPLGVTTSAGCLRLLTEGAGIVDDVPGFVAALTGQSGHPLEDWLAELYRGASVESVARSRGRSVAEVIAELARLEMRDVVVRLPGQRYGPGRSDL